MPSPKIKKAVIPAAGLGTRFLPATKVVPKELLPIVDKPGIQYIVEEALSAGVEEVIFVISPDKGQVVDHFRPAPELEKCLRERGKNDLLQSITFLTDKAKYSVVTQEKPLGLGHAVLCARQAVGDEWFFVFLPDDLIDHEVPCAVQMLKPWEAHGGAILAVMPVPWEEVHQYGVVKAAPLTASLGKVESLVEKPKREQAPSNLAVIGRYLLPPDIFGFLEKIKSGAIGEIQLTDGLAGLAKKGGLYALQFEGERFDIGNKGGFLEANINYALKHETLSQKTLDLIKMLAESR
ncbi:MAG: UTP--glucose-1-phosphate uridylyltransferase [Deltaproteobacteria bacterium]|nr:UTP--glucose-1-phosphate uridylyltransferase [Deltaproteobacteria bacterium]